MAQHPKHTPTSTSVIPSAPTTTDLENLGTFDDETFDSLTSDGFSSTETIKVGDPTVGLPPNYVGFLIGPGEPVELSEADPKTGEFGKIPTWLFHPAVKLPNGSVGFANNMTHVVLSQYEIETGCKGIYKLMTEHNVNAIVGIKFLKMDRIAGKARQITKFRIRAEYMAKPGQPDNEFLRSMTALPTIPLNAQNQKQLPAPTPTDSE